MLHFETCLIVVNILLLTFFFLFSGYFAMIKTRLIIEIIKAVIEIIIVAFLILTLAKNYDKIYTPQKGWGLIVPYLITKLSN